ncbi:MAG: DRTGG domain-containing protein [Dehalococcoidales bacterium]
MGVLFIVSAETAVGKTAIGAGIAVNLLNAGQKVGYLKPQVVDKTLPDGDIAFMKKVLGLEDLVNAPDLIKGRDTVIAEALLGKKPSDAASKDAYGAAKTMKAKVIAVEAYSGGPSKYTDLYQGFRESLLGVIINKVPASQLKRVKEEAGKQFGEAGIKLLGVVPENRALLALTVAELAAGIQGKILNNADKGGELVENYLLGAMVLDSGIDYFSRKNNKAAVIRQDRPDMQLAALETPTNCLVLSGGGEPPLYNVLGKAQAKGVPVVTTDTAIPDIVAGIEGALSNARLHQEKKLAKLAEMVKQNLDMKIFS